MLAAAATTLAFAGTGCQRVGRSFRGRPRIRAPEESAVGEPLRIRLTGFDADASVVLEATATDDRGVEFSTSWSLRTDGRGRVTVPDGAAAATQTKVSSRWTVMGPGLDSTNRRGIEMLFHRITPTADSVTPAHFVVNRQPAVEATLAARVGNDRRAAKTIRRVYDDPDVSKRTVEDANLVGWLYAPPSPGPHPGVVTLHGSHALVPHRLSRLLATRGYATLALQYFGADGLPKTLDGIPLEYFRRATRWLTDREDVRDGRIGLVGISRGVEAALLAAGDFPGRAAVVGYAGGGLLAPGIDESATTFTGYEAAWTRDGTPVAGATPIRRVLSAVDDARRLDCDAPDCVPAAVRERVSAEALRRALVPVESIDGPVLLLTGSNDAQWPAPAVSALAVDRLERRGHDDPYELRSYDGAGHVFGLPYQSYAGEATGPRYGGTPTANAFAAANSWPLVLRYLRLVADET